MIKKTIATLMIASIGSVLLAETTMCFKSNWSDPSTIETTPMDGGKCAGISSIETMKSNGWVTEDIKISSGKTGMDFIYVLKKGGVVALSDGDLESRLNQIQDKREAAKKEAKIKETAANGQKIYDHHCASCHGKNGELEPYNSSKQLTAMSEDEIIKAFREYSNDDKDNGMAIIMKPYVGLVFGDDLEAVAKYIQTLKK